MKRSIRWLDRCVAAHARPTEQNLFAIIQGGLDPELRRTCVKGNSKAYVSFYSHYNYLLLLLLLLLLAVLLLLLLFESISAFMIGSNSTIKLCYVISYTD